MQRFFNDFESINCFTLSLDFHQNELECPHCLKSDHFVSHGVIYKQRSSTEAEKVGKRIFCSNRYSHQGCGRTFQLYVATEVPSFRYGVAQLFIFITSLLINSSVDKAYFLSTGQASFRHAWRWLNRLVKQIGAFRSFLKARPKTTTHAFQDKAHRLQVLLPTLLQLSQRFKSNLCTNYQLLTQKAFI